MQTKKCMQITDVHQSFCVGDETTDVLHEVGLSIEEGSLNIIFGASGSGKSTLLNIMAGLQKPDRGKVLFGDQDIYSLDSDRLANFRAKHIGIMYQQSYWIKSLNVIDNIAMPLHILGYDRATGYRAAQEALGTIGMLDFAKKNPSLLSGGEQQRIAMARALVANPRIIVADEPTGNLDSKNGEEMMNLLHRIKVDYARTIILVTHNLEYLCLADKLFEVRDGKVDMIDAQNNQEIMKKTLLQTKARADRIAKIKNYKGRLI